MDDANSHGGAAGRKINLVVHDFDPLTASSGTDVCRQHAEDDKVFATITDVGIAEPQALCYTRQYGIPIIVYDAQDITTYDQSGGLLFTTMPTNDRIVYDHVTALHEHGYLQGKTIGLVTTAQGGSKAPDRTEIPRLEALGYHIAHRSDLSDDIPTAQSQIPVEINQMRSAGVNFIIWEGGPTYSNIWLNQAQKTGYNPTYSFDESGSGTDDFGLQTVSGQVDGYAWGVRRRAESDGTVRPSVHRQGDTGLGHPDAPHQRPVLGHDRVLLSAERVRRCRQCRGRQPDPRRVRLCVREPRAAARHRDRACGCRRLVGAGQARRPGLPTGTAPRPVVPVLQAVRRLVPVAPTGRMTR